jgi:hypothetical protein
MNVCGSCGSVLVAGDTVCSYCGAAVVDAGETAVPPPPPPPPPPGEAPHVATGAPPLPPLDSTGEFAITPVPEPEPEGRSRRGLMIGLGALVAAAAVGGAIVLLGGDDDDDADAGVTPDTDASTTAAPDTTSGDTAPADTAPADTTAETTPAETTPGPTTTAGPPSEAQALLDDLVKRDKDKADALVLTFVPQLAARYVGMVDDGGATWGASEILAEHNGLREQYKAILVDGGAYKFQLDGQPMTGWYLTFADEGFNTRNEGNKWCRKKDLTEDVCMAVEFKPAV